MGVQVDWNRYALELERAELLDAQLQQGLERLQELSATLKEEFEGCLVDLEEAPEKPDATEAAKWSQAYLGIRKCNEQLELKVSELKAKISEKEDEKTGDYYGWTARGVTAALAAVLGDGSVVTWGSADWGGDSSAVQDQLRDVQQIQASCGAFAAILGNGSVVTWGDADDGGDSSAVQEQLRDVQQIQASNYAFAAILGDGSVVTWGDADYGGDCSAVQHQLKNVQQIQASIRAFAAILGDGSVVTWGHAFRGMDLGPIAFKGIRFTDIQFDRYHREKGSSFYFVELKMQGLVLADQPFGNGVEKTSYGSDGTKIMATAARAEERTRISTFQSTLAETHKGNLQLATVFKKITQLSSGLEPIFQHVGVAIQSMQNIAQAFPSYHRSEGTEAISNRRKVTDIVEGSSAFNDGSIRKGDFLRAVTTPQRKLSGEQGEEGDITETFGVNAGQQTKAVLVIPRNFPFQKVLEEISENQRLDSMAGLAFERPFNDE
ncbi:hypothetical protein AK812_SmicGene42396 [Symbiodinium microadriaticum]|uniref:E3 ubiquitin-protein ligase HERC2 n=1 Tax=Symbiodinium microadriaticum TaxID=2951 RepID=A0A1Q9C3N7_SYMMI|nr:hypothetical protein AK812_SmicGene42396 [Symbiodinium microadriaticum]